MKGPETFSITDIRPGDLTEERIYAILCRWQGLRVLQDLYLDPMIHTKYLNSIFPYVEHDRSTDITLLMESAARILHLQTSSVKNQPGISFSAQQTRRFYKALNSYWLAMEWVWLWSRSIHDTWQENWKMKDMIDNIWRGYHCRSLLESFELIEVHDFVYGFLLRIIFPDFEAMLPWIGENLTIFLADEPDRSIGYDYFVACSRLFLRPPDIIELLIKGGSITKAKNVEYLQLRGAFEITGGVELIKHPARVSLDPWFDVRTLQNGVCRHIKDIGDNTEATRNLLKLWKLFRENWKQDARWTLFWWAGSSDDILVRLESRKPIA